MIVVTGAAGFIGSMFMKKLNQAGYDDLVAVDDFSIAEKSQNLKGVQLSLRINRKRFFTWLDENHKLVQFIYHLGARTDTTEFDKKILNDLNLEYSKEIWKRCAKYSIPLVYASSAATYGGGEHGFTDNHEIISKLKPLNPYGDSKNDFDKWALKQTENPFYWVGLKFFNVYGPNETHKGRMASVVFHAFNQIQETGEMKLFRSHRQEIAHGEQQRDFVYVKDVTEVLLWLMHHRLPQHSGIYNLGSGTARTFVDLAKSTFSAIGKPESIYYIDIPEDIREKYQYFTEASMQKLSDIGYKQPFYSLEEGITDYIQNYLLKR